MQDTSYSYLEYRKAAHENLLNINNNLSIMLQESFAGIDSICQKVRVCLLESKLSTGHTEPINCKTSVTTQDVKNNIKEQHSLLDISTIEEDSTYDADDNKIKVETGRENNYKKILKENKGTQKQKKPIGQQTKTQIRTMKPFYTILKTKTSIDSFGEKEKTVTTKPTIYQEQHTRKGIGLFNNYKSVSTISSVKEKPTQHFREPKQCESMSRISREDQSSASDLSSIDLYIGRNQFLFDRLSASPAIDVYRKKAITNLHGKLIAQVEASDSLAFFQKVMTRNKNRVARSRPATVAEMGGRAGVRSRTESNTIRSSVNLPRKYDNSLWFDRKNSSKTKRKIDEDPQKKNGKSSKYIAPCLPKSYSLNPCRNNGIMTPQPSVREPTTFSDRHRAAAEIGINRIQQLDHFDILDDITTNDLMPLKAEYPRKDTEKINEPELSEQNANIEDLFLYKLVYSKEKENAWSYLFEPSIKCSKETCNSCKKSPTNGRGDDLKKLCKYIFPIDDVRDEGITNVYTVMPVHVIYNKDTIDGAQKLPLMPMKECKGTRKRAEWLETGKKNKPMKVVYDPALKRIEKEIKLVSATQENNPRHQKALRINSWSPKNFDRYCLTELAQKNMSSRTQKPKNVSQNDCTEIFNTSPKAQALKLPESERCAKRSKINTNYTSPSPSDYLNLDTHVWTKDNIERGHQKNPDIETSEKLEAMLKKNAKPEREKKLWVNKYGKTPGQKLTKFIENQPTNYQLSPPKYAMPIREQAVLEQLKTLKQKNDHVSSNIQKAIQVIENKMVDILSKPKTNDSMEAFDEMEKEITSVLTLMKTPTAQKSKIGKILEEDKDAEQSENEIDVSDQLIKKLENILSSAIDTSSAASLVNDLPQNTPKRKNLPKNITCSATSTSTDETYTVKQHRPKHSLNNKTTAANNSASRKYITNSPTKDINDSLNASQCKSVDTHYGSSSQKNSPRHEKLTSAGDQLKIFDGESESQSIAVMLNRGDCECLIAPEKNKIVGNGTHVRTQEEIRDIATETKTVAYDITEENASSKSSRISNSKAEKISRVLSNEESLEDRECSLEEQNNESMKQEPRLYDEVDKIISRVENVYSQLQDFEDQVKREELPKITTFRDEVEEMDVKSEMFLTPFMHALKDLGEGKRTNESPDKSPSYYNIIRFLDTLSDLREDQPTEVYTARHCHFPQLVHIPNTFHPLDIQHNSQYIPTITIDLTDTPSRLEKSFATECLSTFSMPVNKHEPSYRKVVERKSKSLGKPVAAIKSKKSNQHFAFKSSKQEKATQATPCPLHNARTTRKQSKQQLATTTTKSDIDYLKQTVHEKICPSEVENDETRSISLQSSSVTHNQPMSTELERTECQFTECYEEEEKSDTNSSWSNNINTFQDIKDQNTNETFQQTIILGNYHKIKMQTVKHMLSRDNTSKKRDTLEKIKQKEETFLKETILLRPIKQLNDFIDPELLKQAVQERQHNRILRRKSWTDLTQTKKHTIKSCNGKNRKRENETLLKGVYAFVYLLMFTALNLEYKCVY